MCHWKLCITVRKVGLVLLLLLRCFCFRFVAFFAFVICDDVIRTVIAIKSHNHYHHHHTAITTITQPLTHPITLLLTTLLILVGGDSDLATAAERSRQASWLWELFVQEGRRLHLKVNYFQHTLSTHPLTSTPSHCLRTHSLYCIFAHCRRVHYYYGTVVLSIKDGDQAFV